MKIILFLISSVVTIIVIFYPYRSKSSFIKYIINLVPIFGLIYLCWVPIDIGSAIVVWFAALIIFLLSIVSLLSNLTRIIWLRFFKNKSVIFRMEAIRFINPLFVIIIVIVSYQLVKFSLISADEYAIEISKKIYNSCNVMGKCPEDYKEWSFQGRNKRVGSEEKYLEFSKKYGKFGTKYKIYYLLSEDKKDFSIIVRHNIDEGLYIKGGIDKKLQAEECVEHNCRELQM